MTLISEHFRSGLVRHTVSHLVSVAGVLGCCLLGLLQPVSGDDAVEMPLRQAPLLTGKNWNVLYVPGRPQRNVQPLDQKHKLVPLDELSLTGPNPGHPFVLGNFRADARWGIVEGGVQVVGGKNGALELARGEQLELEGRIAQTGLGGWFLLLGWEQDRGYCISNVVMKDAASGAPWFLTEFRGGKAIDGAHTEFPKFEWTGDQPFRLMIKDQELSLSVGPKAVFERQRLENYQSGAVILGVYDTRYGPRMLRLISLRGRSLDGP